MILDKQVDTNAVRYTFKTILEDFLGLAIEFSNEYKESEKTTIYYGFPSELSEKCDLIIFSNNLWLKDNYLKEHSMPKIPLKKYNDKNLLLVTDQEDVPVIYQAENTNDNIYIRIDADNISTNIDFIASIFFMLSRYEEVIINDRDEHDRFPADKSLAFKEDFLNRPIVNEYVEIIWDLLKKRNPKMKRKKRQFNLLLTHDVDDFKVGSFIKRVKLIFAQLFLHKSLQKFFKVLWVNTKWIFTFPKSSFRFINKISSKYEIKSIFYFLVNGTNATYDPNSYNIEDEKVKKIIQSLSDNEHEFGLHASYSSHLNKKQIKKELKMLENATNIKTNNIRFHYLRFRVPDTLQLISELDFKQDSSIAYSICNGYRTGVCYPFKLFDVVKGKELNITENPLIVMDTVMNKKYGKLTKKQIVKDLQDIANKIAFFDGDFIILFHNESFEELQLPWRSIYRQLIRYCRELI